jgi:hypothetical protein
VIRAEETDTKLRGLKGMRIELCLLISYSAVCSFSREFFAIFWQSRTRNKQRARALLLPDKRELAVHIRQKQREENLREK